MIDEKSVKMLEEIYYGNFYPAGEIPDSEEYQKLVGEIAKITNTIRNSEIDEIKKEKFNECMEMIAIKEGMEAENQFKLGFKFATKLIMEGMK